MKVNKTWGEAWPEITIACKTIVLGRRLAFARSSGEIMDVLGYDVATKHTVSATALNWFSKDSMAHAVLQAPASVRFFQDRKATAGAILLLGAGLALDQDAERALKQFMRASLGRSAWDATTTSLRALLVWGG